MTTPPPYAIGINIAFLFALFCFARNATWLLQDGLLSSKTISTILNGATFNDLHWRIHTGGDGGYRPLSPGKQKKSKKWWEKGKAPGNLLHFMSSVLKSFLAWDIPRSHRGAYSAPQTIYPRLTWIEIDPSYKMNWIRH